MQSETGNSPDADLVDEVGLPNDDEWECEKPNRVRKNPKHEREYLVAFRHRELLPQGIGFFEKRAPKKKLREYKAAPSALTEMDNHETSFRSECGRNTIDNCYTVAGRRAVNGRTVLNLWCLAC